MEQVETASKVNWGLKGNFLLSPELRRAAIQVLETTPFPTTRNEAWKYTRVTRIKNGNFSVSDATLATNNFRISDDSLNLVFVNGHFSPELSDAGMPDGVKVLPLSAMDEAERAVFGKDVQLENEIFNAFNAAYTTDGVYIHISAKIEVEKTIELTFISSGENVLTNVRNIIVAEAFSKAHIVQQFVSEHDQPSFTNAVTEVSVGANAFLTIDKLQQESENAFQVATEQVDQAKDSEFTINTVTLNGGLVRNNLNIRVNGQNCTTNLTGIYVLKGNQLADNHTVVDHKVANCVSNELYKGVMDGKSTAVFNGKVFVRKDAQKINAFQSNANVLISDDATVNSKPELEIYADDVKCSHGSTTGQLDEEAVFYLRARGISEKSARQLMIGAFVADAIEKIEHEGFRQTVEDLLSSRFNWNN